MSTYDHYLPWWIDCLIAVIKVHDILNECCGLCEGYLNITDISLNCMFGTFAYMHENNQ